MTAYPPEQIERLTAINLDDMLAALGCEKAGLGRWLLKGIFREAARRFARQVLDFDSCAAGLGLQAGSQEFLKSRLRELVIAGQEQIPTGGPLLLISNHPGLLDTVALFASIPRPDLKIVAAERPFLRALPAAASRLIYVPEAGGARVTVIRQAAQVLRQGGAVLTFPAGHIEPDPDVLPGALASLAEWGSSTGVFARLVPGTAIVPALVRGVLASKATFHPFTHLRRQKKDRERLGATLQILASVIWPDLWKDLWKVSVRVSFGPPVSAAGLVHLQDPERITRAVMERVGCFYRAELGQDGYSSTT